MRRLLVGLGCLLLVGVLSSSTDAQLFSFFDDFESYTDVADLEMVWAPDSGDGNSPTGGPIAILAPNTLAPAPFDGSGDAGVTPPVDPLVGQAVTLPPSGGVNEYTGSFSLVPTANTSIRYSADIFDFVNGNRNATVGLRNDTADRDPGIGTAFGLNFFEIGFHNQDTFDPTDPANAPPNDPVLDVPTTGYAYRIVLVNEGGDLVRDPNYQYFELDPAFDDPNFDHNGDGRVGNGDGLVSPVDVGPGWHTFTATINESTVMLELDLFRDGSVDSMVEWEISFANDDATGQPAPLTSLRMGGPSGVPMNEFTMIDNVLLEEFMVGTGVDCDFTGDTLCNGADIDLLMAAIASGGNDPAFDLTGDGNVDLADRDMWLADAGNMNIGAPYLVADFNLDGNVDGQDFVDWNSNKFTANSDWTAGNANGDGNVDGQDFVAWNSNKFTSSDGQVGAVPEPAFGGLLLLVVALAWRRR